MVSELCFYVEPELVEQPAFTAPAGRRFVTGRVDKYYLPRRGKTNPLKGG